MKITPLLANTQTFFQLSRECLRHADRLTHRISKNMFKYRKEHEERSSQISNHLNNKHLIKIREDSKICANTNRHISNVFRSRTAFRTTAQ